MKTSEFLRFTRDVSPASRTVLLPCAEDEAEGWVHSTESFGTADGPGIRFIVFMQGCPLRCLYCHNPDARVPREGARRSVPEILQEIQRSCAFYRGSRGGITVSGGEPLLQPTFVSALLKACRAEGIHTALDTSGYAGREAAGMVLPFTDLVLLDLKSWDWDTHRQVTGVDPLQIRCFAQDLADAGKPVWIRFVLVPGLTDAPANIEGLAYFASRLGNVERVEVIPFHKMGEPKWERPGLSYTLRETPPPGEKQIADAVEIFRSYGLAAF